MNILQRRRTRTLGLDFWEKQYKSIIDRSITKLIVPDGTTAIKGYSLYGCSLLKDIQWANTITSIGGYSFRSCVSLTSVEIPASVSSIGTYAFANCTNLRNVTIPSSVRSIGDFAFTTSGIINLTISEGVTSLGQQCFASNTALVNLVIPDSVTTLGNAPFRQCSGLKNITIGSGITSLVNEMFWTAKPNTLTMRRTTPPTALLNNFQTWPTHIYVPAESVELYKTASVWSTYASRIEADPATQYDSKVEYIDVTGKWLVTDIDSVDVCAFDFTFEYNGAKSGTILAGGNFEVCHAGGGIMEGRVVTQGTGVNTSTYALAANQRLRVYCNDTMTSVIFYGAITRSVTYSHPVSTESGVVSAFYKEGAGVRNAQGTKIVSLVMYDNNGSVIFEGIPVRRGQEGALYDTIHNRMYFWTGEGDGYGTGEDVE